MVQPVRASTPIRPSEVKDEAPPPSPSLPPPPPSPPPPPAETTVQLQEVPTVQTAQETRLRAQHDPTTQKVEKAQPDPQLVQSYLRDSLRAVEDSEAEPQVKQTVRSQLERTAQRLEQGEISPKVALEQGKVWNSYLHDSATGQIQARIARAEAIEQMGPLQRAHEGLIGVGTGVLKTVQSAGQLAETVNHLNPVTATTNFLAGTVVDGVRTGDWGKSFDHNLKQQLEATQTAGHTVLQTTQNLGQVAADINQLNPVLAPGALLADTVAGTLQKGDLGAAAQVSWQTYQQNSAASGERLLRLAGDISGFNQITSGDPRLIGEGVFNLGTLVAPYAQTKTPGVVTQLDDLTAVPKNNIVPFQRPEAAGVPRVVPPKTQPPGAVALLEPQTLPRIVPPSTSLSTVTPPPTGVPGRPVLAGLGGGNNGHNNIRRDGANPLPSDEEVPYLRDVERLADHFRRKNGLDRLRELLGHDRRHALLGKPTNRKGEALINGAEETWIQEATKANLSPDFLRPENLQKSFDRYADAVQKQLERTRTSVLTGDTHNVEDLLNKLPDAGEVNRLETHLEVAEILQKNGVAPTPGGPSFDDILMQNHPSNAAYKEAVRGYIEQNLSIDRANILQRFKSDVAHLKALQDANPRRSLGTILNDDVPLRRAPPSAVKKAYQELQSSFDLLR